MKKLIIDCAGSDLLIAADIDGKIAYKRGGGERNNGLVMPYIDELLQDSGLKISDIDAVACTVGPGSFTGIRIGIATAKAISDVVGCKKIAVNTLQAAAYDIKEKKFIVALKCRNGEYYAAAFENSAENMTDCKVMGEEELNNLGCKVIYFDGKSDAHKLAATANYLKDRSDNTLIPLYLKKSQAERMKDGD